jgi:poly(A) polymerase
VRSVLGGALAGSRGEPFPGSAPAIDPAALAGTRGEQVRPLLEQVLLGPGADLALVFLHGTGFLDWILPEVTAMIDFEDEHARHKDLWTHTIRVVAQVEPRAVVRWAALLHDVGKVVTRSIDEHGKVHFFGHEVAGARMFKRIAARLGFPRDQASRIRFLVRNHLRAGQYEPSWTDSAVRRFGKEMGDALEDLVALSRADITTRYERKKNRNLMLLDELVSRVERIRAADAIPPALPKGLGNALMDRFGLGPGPALGRIMSRLERLVDRGELPRSGEHAVYLAHLEAHPEDREDG